MTDEKLAGRYQQSSAGYSGITLTGRPHEREANEEDAERHNIPPGYNLEHWDPNEKPIILLGTVFDCNSLGKWIFDFTVHKYGPQAPMSQVAGDLWLVLIQFYGNIKKTEEYIDWNKGCRNPSLLKALDMLEEFIYDGKSLRKRLDRLLEKCEEPMLRTDLLNTGRLGKEAGLVFVETLLGREQLLEETEELKESIRHWIHDWDEECAGTINPRREANR